MGNKYSTNIISWLTAIVNAWYVNRTDTYTITLEFWPQKLFYIGSTISITTLILCILYLSKNKITTLYGRALERIRNKNHLSSKRKNR